MTIRLRTVFFVLLGIVFLWFLYIERAILTPFILGAVFAYLFNPLINFLSQKIRLPRTLSVITIYLIIIALISIAGTALTRRIIAESSEFTDYINQLINATKANINALPDWIRPIVNDALLSLEQSKLLSPQALFSLFPQALSRIISFILFIFSGFYFLKEGRQMVDKLLNLVPKDHRIDVEILVRRINAVLQGYLRGQIFLVFLISVILFIALSVLGVRFALIVAVFSGIAEIVPIIGPIVATSVAATVAFFSGNLSFSLTPLQGAVAVIAVYTLVRQIQDYLINPFVMGKITKLHPLIILFSVLAGEHVWGLPGLILAVPAAATIKIFIEFCFDKINEKRR